MNISQLCHKYFVTRVFGARACAFYLFFKYFSIWCSIFIRKAYSIIWFILFHFRGLLCVFEI